MIRKILFVSIACFLLAAAAAAQDLPQWWVDSTFYEIFVRSFYDSNGDGIGDLRGIIQKLDYLNDGDPATTFDLGITGIWLMPINPSPSYHGYDIKDYYRIEPEYGTMEDFKELVREARRRGIRVIMDLVLNHCSYMNPWFRKKRDWFIWSKTDPGYYGPWGQQVWWPRGGYYYYGIFSETMPDFNYRNPEAVAQMDNVVRYWLKQGGVDGFRLDAARHIVEEGELQADTDSTHNFWKKWRINFKNTSPEAVAVGEIWSDTSSIAEYVQGDELDTAFNFPLAGAILDSASSGRAFGFSSELKQSMDLIPDGRFSTFISNHDQNRVMSQLAGNTMKAKAAASLLFASPGTPFIYYGEEIGMEGSKPDEDIRRPMQWSSAPNAGFTTRESSWRAPHANYITVNVDAQTGEPESMLSHYRELISIRNDHPAMRSKRVYNIKASSKAVYAGLRLNEGEAVVIIVNLGSSPITDCALSLSSSPLSKRKYHVSALMGGGTFADLEVKDSGEISNYPLASIPAYETMILRLLAK
jgi:glycosidase